MNLFKLSRVPSFICFIDLWFGFSTANKKIADILESKKKQKRKSFSKIKMSFAATALRPGQGLSNVLGKAVRIYKGKSANVLQNVGFFEKIDPEQPLNSVYNQATIANKKAIEQVAATYDNIQQKLTPEYFRNTFKVEGATIENGNEDVLFKDPPFDIFRKHASNPSVVDLVEKLYRGYTKKAAEYEANQAEQGKKILEDVERVASDMVCFLLLFFFLSK